MTIPITPSNTEAEKSVIGAIMLSRNADDVSNAISLLQADDFYIYAHKIIFGEIKNLATKNIPVDVMTVNQKLETSGSLADVGGFAYLAEIAKNTPSVANLNAYVYIVKDAAIKRFAIAKLQESEALLYSPTELNVKEILGEISQKLTEVFDYSATSKKTGLRNAVDIADEWMVEQSERSTNPEVVRGLTTGIEALDQRLSPKGIVKGSLFVIGARPKMGKTTLYSKIAINCVLNEKKPALLFSLEMPSKQIFERMLGQKAQINTDIFYQEGSTDDAVFSKASAAMGDLTRNSLLYIDDTPAVSLLHIRNECRKIKREKGEVGLIGVDYLTLMKGEKAERNDLAYGAVTKGLKALAKELDCVVVLLTQLNRDLEKRSNKRPMPSDSRDTGQIEQECDYWLGIYRDSAYEPTADKTLTELILRLNRHGETGTTYVNHKYGSIYDCDQVKALERANKQQTPTENDDEW